MSKEGSTKMELVNIEGEFINETVEHGKIAWQRIVTNSKMIREDWVLVGNALSYGRERNKSHKAFGQWCQANGFGNIDNRVRSDAMWLSRNTGVFHLLENTLNHPTAIRQASNNPEKKLHLAQGTGENEWFTPEDIIMSVREVMGGIDLDPASNAEANKTVGADLFFSIDDDGLAKEWHGRVWLNPPYSRDLMPLFVDKLITEYREGRTEEAIMVSHNNTETKWFQSLSRISSAICFPSTRIKFYRAEDVADPVNGQVFFYLGQYPESFIGEFGMRGVCFRYAP